MHSCISLLVCRGWGHSLCSRPLHKRSWMQLCMCHSILLQCRHCTPSSKSCSGVQTAPRIWQSAPALSRARHPECCIRLQQGCCGAWASRAGLPCSTWPGSGGPACPWATSSPSPWVVASLACGACCTLKLQMHGRFACSSGFCVHSSGHMSAVCSLQAGATPSSRSKAHSQPSLLAKRACCKCWACACLHPLCSSSGLVAMT